LGKIKVQCPQVAGTAEIRSAEPVNFGLPIPLVGTTVWVAFNGGDLTKPMYFANTSSFLLIQDWTNFTILSGFTGNGNSNGTPQFQIVSEFNSVKVNLKGGLNITYPSSTIANAGDWCSTIPVAARPSTLRSLAAACSSASSTVNSLKADFRTDGTAALVGTNTTTDQPPWASLNGLSYYI
jgi:hypothetical protein